MALIAFFSVKVAKNSIIFIILPNRASGVQSAVWVFWKSKKKLSVRQPGIEPGSIAWKATMLTFTPPTLHTDILFATIKIFEKFVNSPKNL